ncbi:unnamed protein product, partial [Chrysoparadoxa australica]
MSQGFMSAFPGGKVRLAVDTFLPACQIMANWLSGMQEDEVVMQQSIYHDTLRKRCADICPTFLIGGTPCPDFSRNGKQVEGARAKVTLEFVSLVVESKTLVMVMENVPEILQFQTYTDAKNILVNAGYVVLPITVSGKAAGLPTSRRRVFICALNSKR